MKSSVFFRKKLLKAVRPAGMCLKKRVCKQAYEEAALITPRTAGGASGREGACHCRRAGAYRCHGSSGNSCTRHTRRSSSTRGCGMGGSGFPTRP